MSSVPSLANGRYELREFISKGGMGAVYRAWDVELDRWVAVKCLLDVARKGSRDLALKEAKTLASLSHPNIMRIYDILNVDERGDESEQVWIVSEWLEGRCLAQMPLPLPPACVLAIMAQVYDALAAAHAAQIIHRDVKPSNVMIGDGGRISLIDFGVAFAPGMSTGETMVGSLRYSDPRILEGRQPDVHSDLFSAALLQIELMTGETVLPDLAPLPLYRHIRRNLAPRLESLLDGTYPPLAALARRHTGEMLEALNDPKASLGKSFSASHSAAREAALIAQDLLRKLTNKTPDQYLASGLCLGRTDDHEADDIIAAETEAAIASPLLTPRQKAAWVAYQSASDWEREDESREADPTADVGQPESFEAKTSESPAKRRALGSTLAPLLTILGSTIVILGILLWMKLTVQDRPDNSVALLAPEPQSAPIVLNGSTFPEHAETLTPPLALPKTDDAKTRIPTSSDAVATAAESGKSRVAATVPVHLAANAWAVVTLDGREIGRLPQAAPFAISPGRHRLRLENPVVEPLEVDIDVRADESNRLRFTLNPKTTPRVIKLARPGRLYVDGIDLGVVSTKALPLTYGPHEIWIKRDDEIVKLDNIAIGPDSPMELLIEE